MPQGLVVRFGLGLDALCKIKSNQIKITDLHVNSSDIFIHMRQNAVILLIHGQMSRLSLRPFSAAAVTASAAGRCRGQARGRAADHSCPR